ncbi:MAG TPA: DUF5009 domain-containing protein [Trichocoleus sp.]
MWLWSASPIPWLFQFYYLKYLFTVLPGTIAGDQLLHWLQNSCEFDRPALTAGTQRFWLISVWMLLIPAVLLVGLQARWLWQTTILSFVPCGVG